MAEEGHSRRSAPRLPRQVLIQQRPRGSPRPLWFLARRLRAAPGVPPNAARNRRRRDRQGVTATPPMKSPSPFGEGEAGRVVGKDQPLVQRRTAILVVQLP